MGFSQGEKEKRNGNEGEGGMVKGNASFFLVAELVKRSGDRAIDIRLRGEAVKMSGGLCDRLRGHGTFNPNNKNSRRGFLNILFCQLPIMSEQVRGIRDSTTKNSSRKQQPTRRTRRVDPCLSTSQQR